MESQKIALIECVETPADFSGSQTHAKETAQESKNDNVSFQARNQYFMWGGANEAKVDQTTEMYFLLSDRSYRKVAIHEKL